MSDASLGWILVLVLIPFCMFSDFDSSFPKMDIIQNGISDFYCVSVNLGLLYVNGSVVLVLLDYILRERDKEFCMSVFLCICICLQDS